MAKSSQHRRMALRQAGPPRPCRFETSPRLTTIRTVTEGRRRAAELLVQCLEHEGVTCVFGIPGEENIHLTDALSRSSIRYVLVRHEQAASFMAEIHGRLTGSAGVCSATLGP